MARGFDGSTESAYRDSHGAVTTGSMSLWFRPNTLPASGDRDVLVILSASAGATVPHSTFDHAFFLRSDGVLSFYGFDGGVKIIRTTTAMVAGNWYHAAATFDGTTARLYLNGSEEASAAMGALFNGGNLVYAPDCATVNDGETNANRFDGSLAEAANWSAVLTTTEVLALARGQLPFAVRRDSQASYYPFWGLHSPEIDLKNPSAGLTLSGTARTNHAPVAPFSRRFWLPSLPSADAAAAFNPAWAGGANRLIGGGAWGG